MKTRLSNPYLAFLIFPVMLASTALPTSAETIYWDGTAISPGSWDDAANWSTDSAATTPDPLAKPGASDGAVFNISTVNTDQVIHLNNTNQAVNSLTFSSAGNTTIIRSVGATSTVSRTITLGAGGLTVNSGAGNVTTGIGAGDGSNQFVNIGLIGNNFFKNDSSSALTIGRQVTTANDLGAITLTVNGSGSGLTDFQREIFNGTNSTVSVQISTAADHTTLFRNAGSTFSGGLVINSGLVGARASNGFGAGTITINGGAIGATVSTRTFANNLVIGGNVQFGGINNVAGGGSSAATWNGNVDLGNATRTITLGGNTQTFAGVISNGGLTVSASGGTYTLAITTPSTYAGGTTINTDATLSLGNATDTLKDDGTINVNGGTLNVDNPDTVGAVTLSSGTISGDSALTGSSYAVQSGEITTGLAGSGIVMTKSTPGVVIANNSTSSYDGGTVLNEGTLAIRASGTPLGTGPITINGGIIGSVVITRTIPNDVVVNSDFQLGGANVPALATSGTTFNGNVNLGGATRTITLANSATFNGVISNGGLTIIANPTNRVLTLAGNSTYTGLTNLNAGTLIINGDNSAATGQINVAADASLGGNGTSGAAVVFTPGAGLAARITDWTGAAGTGYEDLAVASLNAGGGALNLVVTATGLVNFTETNKSFTILNASGGISGFNPANVTITTTGFTGTGTWALAQSGTSLVLNYTGADPFQNWIDPFTVADETKGGDPDNDGSSNLMEFVLNGNPGISDTNILPDLALNSTDFTFSYVRREDSTGVPQVVQYGSDLSGWTDVSIPTAAGTTNVGAASVTVGTPSGGTQTVTVTIPTSASVGGKLFARLMVGP